VDSGCGNVEQDLFDWDELEDDGGHNYPNVQNPVLQRFLTIHSMGKAAAWLVGRSQARTDRVPEVNDFATAFEMHERIQRDCSTKIYLNNAFRCVLPNSIKDVNRLYLKNKYAIK
jgi:hypothetical protein